MNNSSIKVMIAIASIFSLRMLGLFMAIPVISIYAYHLPQGTALLSGVALGIYGLTQACLQLPFGMCSDKLGRKPVIYFGLSVFLLGSLLAAFAHNIIVLILGRALQGAGAIGSTLIATIADFSTEAHRSKAMAMIGMSIGVAFILGFVSGPVISFYWGVPAIFFLTVLLSCLGILICYHAIPTQPPYVPADKESFLALLPKVLRDPDLLRLDLGIFVQHAIMTASFTVLPFIFKYQLAVTRDQQWWLYLCILLGSFLLSVPILLMSERKHQLKRCFLMMIVLILMAQLGLFFFSQQFPGLLAGLTFYFIAFNVLEAMLPAMVSKISPVMAKGTAMGVYSTAQFLGIFFGAIVAGYLLEQHYFAMIFVFTSCLALLWLCVTFGLKAPPQSCSYQLHYPGGAVDSTVIKTKLEEYTSILDVAILPNESELHLKVDQRRFGSAELHAIKSWLASLCT